MLLRDSSQPWKSPPIEGASDLLRAFFLNLHRVNSSSKSSGPLVTVYVVPQHCIIKCVLFLDMVDHKIS